MSLQFNLVDEGWIPCVDSSGHAVELGLRETLSRSHELRQVVGGSPLVTASLHRLLLAILHRVFGPATYGAWAELREAGHWDAAQIEDYLACWRHRFELFDPEHPFYQAADDRVKPKAANSLMLELAFGNKGTLFDHHLDDGGIVLSPPEAARAIVTAQSFGLAGLSGLREKFTDGTCARGILFLVEGATLFETLILNLIRYPTDDDVLPHSAEDRPCWEQDDPFVPNRSLPTGYLDYLTWQNRRILLLPQVSMSGAAVRHMTIAPGLRMDATVLDPMKHYRIDPKRGPLPRRFTEGRALWRDSASLFSLRAADQHPPRTFLWLAELAEEDHLDGHQALRYVALGMANNQARVDFYRSERMPLPMRYLRDETLLARLREALDMAEAASRQLWGAARTMAGLALSPQADDAEARRRNEQDAKRLLEQWAVGRVYWARLEVPFRRTLESLPLNADAALRRWSDVLHRTAWDALERAATGLGISPTNLKAAVRGRAQLAAGLAKVLPRGGPTA